MMRIHNPMPIKVHADGFSIDCVCGHRGEVYSTGPGARHAFVQHVADDAALALGLELDREHTIALVAL